MTDSTQPEPQPTTRRDFLQKAVLFTGAGLALGGIAAYAKGRLDGEEVVAVPSTASSDALQSQLTEANNQVAMLQQALNASEAALAELRPKLTAALTENADLQNTLSQQKAEAEALRAQLTDAQTELDKHKQLIALFDKLEGLDLDSLLLNGLTSATAGLLGLLNLSPLVTDGIKLARGLMDSFEKQFPIFRASMDWLKSSLDTMNAGIITVETAIAQAVSSLDPVTTRMSQFVGYILDNLPFGIGKSAKAALDANDGLYGTLPGFVTNARAQVIAQFIDPFSDGDKGWSKAILKPIREKALDPSDKLSTQIKDVNEAFVRDLQTPASAALDKRAEIRKEIANFRETNKL